MSAPTAPPPDRLPTDLPRELSAPTSVERRMDRRAAYTRQAIQRALYDLMAERPFGKISVADLCRTADVNRATFYRHYEDKYQLVDELIDEAIEDAASNEAQQDLDVCQQLPTSEDHLLLYRDLEVGARIIARIVEQRGSKRIKEIKELTHLGEEDARLLQVYTAYGNFAINRLLGWQHGEAWQDAQRVIKRFSNAGFDAFE